MISRQELLTLLEELKTNKNNYEIQEYIDRINSMDDDMFFEKLEELGVSNEKQAKKFIKKDLKSKKRTKKEKFKRLNDFVSYGVRKKTIHIHLIPKDIHSMLNSKGLRKGEFALIDALEKIQDLIQTDKRFKDIESVYAVSGIITRPISRIFENLDFDMKILPKEQAKEDEELKKFDFLVEGKDEFKNLGRAKLSKEKLISEEWNKLRETRKKEIEGKLDLDFLNSLQKSVKSDNEIKVGELESKQKQITKEEKEKF